MNHSLKNMQKQMGLTLETSLPIPGGMERFSLIHDARRAIGPIGIGNQLSVTLITHRICMKSLWHYADGRIGSLSN